MHTAKRVKKSSISPPLPLQVLRLLCRRPGSRDTGAPGQGFWEMTGQSRVRKKARQSLCMVSRGYIQ